MNARMDNLVSASMGSFGARLDNFDAHLDNFGARLDNFGVRLDNFGARMDNFSVRMDSFGHQINSLSLSVGGLLTSTLTPVANSVAMHVMPSVITATLGPVPVSASSGGALLPDLQSPSPLFGFLRDQVLHGMSGGPVMDAQCGVVGIIHGLTINTAFVSLDEVDEWLRVARL